MATKEEVTLTDRQTGEITQVVKTRRFRAKNSEEFYFTFVQTMALLHKISSMEDIRLLTQLCLLMSYDTNEVLLPAGRRKKLAEDLKMHDTSISRSLARLKEAGVLTGDRGSYLINPVFFWKGSKDTRDNLLRNRGLEFRIIFGGQDNG